MIRTDAARELAALTESRFDDLRPGLERRLHRAVGMLDWEFTLVAAPGHDLDLVHVGEGLNGGLWTLADPVPWGERAREALVEGYAERAPEAVAEYRTNRSCYELLQLTRAGAHVAEWLALAGLDDEERVAAAAAA